MYKTTASDSKRLSIEFILASIKSRIVQELLKTLISISNF